MEVLLNNKHQFAIYEQVSTVVLKQHILEKLGFGIDDFYLTLNGKRVCDEDVLDSGRINIVPRLCGGKGGFGSMLRAIGAQIEKTTNREACRDLSGRRLRDINEEQRLKTWINQQAEREKETIIRKQKKLERLCEQPKHEFKDESYDKERSALPELVEDAVLQGLQASCSTKRKQENPRKIPKKKPKLWVDQEFDELSDSEDCSSDEESKSSLVNEASSPTVKLVKYTKVAENITESEGKTTEEMKIELTAEKGDTHEKNV